MYIVLMITSKSKINYLPVLYLFQKLDNIHQRVQQAVQYVNETYNDTMTYQVNREVTSVLLLYLCL